MTNGLPAHTLVTGAAGFIGRSVVRELQVRGIPFIAVNHAWRTIGEVDAIVGGRKLARCIHLGWYTAPRDYLTSHSANRRCFDMSLDLVEWLGGTNCRHLLVSGSSAEYGATDDDLVEDARLEPATLYGASKAALRLILKGLWCGHDRGLAWARIFNVTGPGENGERLLPAVVRALKSGMPVDLSDGCQVRDYLDVRDVAAAIAQLSFGSVSGDFNVCSGQGMSIRELLEAAAAEVGGEHLLRFGARPRRVGEFPRIVGSNRRLSATGWQPTYPITRSIRDLAELADVVRGA